MKALLFPILLALEITAEELGVGVTLRPAESDDL